MEYQNNIVSKINIVLSQNNVENNGDIISFYDLIEYAKKELSELEKITKKNSILAEEINNYSFINKYIGKYITRVKTEVLNDKNDIKSTIVIDDVFGDLTLTKNKNSNIIMVDPTYVGKEKFLGRHFDTINYTFDKLEEYSKLIGNIDNNMYCFMYDLNSIFHLRIYYNAQGYINYKVYVRDGIEENKYYEDESIKNFIEINTDELLKKFSFNMNSDLSIYDNNSILLLAQRAYNEEKKLEKQKVKSISN